MLGMFRILHCIPTLLGGGAERQLCYLAGGLARRGHDVHVAFQQQGPNYSLLRDSGARLHPIPNLRATDPRTALALVRIVRRERIQVLQTWLARMDVWGAIAALSTRIPWVFGERSQAMPLVEKNASARAVRALAPLASVVVSNSETAATLWRGALGARTPVRAVPNALPLDEIARATPVDPGELGLSGEGPLVLFAGRLNEDKGVPVLCEALRSLMADRPELRALLLGVGPLLEPTRAWVRAQGLEGRVVVPGYREDLFRWLKAATVFVSGSRYEGRPNVVMEAMACGCPVVLSDINPHRDLVPGDAAAWVPVDDAPALRDAIARSLDRPDDARARSMRAREAVARFSIDAMVAQYEAIYREVTDGR